MPRPPAGCCVAAKCACASKTQRNAAGAWRPRHAASFSSMPKFVPTRTRAPRARSSAPPAARAATAASTPATTATTAKPISEPGGDDEGQALVGEHRRDDRREPEPGRDPGHRAEQRGDDRLVADHPPHLAARHADRAQRAELARALEGREHERVDDAEQRHDHGQREQDVEDGQQLVDPTSPARRRTRPSSATCASGGARARPRRVRRP